MSEPTCATCRFWPIDRYGGGEGGYNTDGSHSPCRRRAPVFFPDERSTSTFAGAGTRWPFTAKSDWCGEHEPRTPPIQSVDQNQGEGL